MQDTASQFDPFFDDSSTSDIVVMAGEAKIHAHKIVLSAHSPLFKAMFQVMLRTLHLHSCDAEATVMHYADWHKGEHSSGGGNG
jgi:hypothetical protein